MHERFGQCIRPEDLNIEPADASASAGSPANAANMMLKASAASRPHSISKHILPRCGHDMLAHALQTLLTPLTLFRSHGLLFPT